MTSKTLRMVLVVAVALAVIISIGLTLRGRGLRIGVLHRVRAILNSKHVKGDGDLTNILFIHHSTGRHLLRFGGIREELAAAGLQLWDHDYNHIGLTGPDGTSVGYSYGIPGDNTDPDGFARLFSQTVSTLPWNAFSGVMQHDVIVFKSCFPVSHISSADQLLAYQSDYRAILKVMDQYPEKLFIIVTPPPLIPSSTDPEAAARARAFAQWLSLDEFLGNRHHVLTFDLFDLLAENDPNSPDMDMLRVEFRDGEDSHPNRLANETIGPIVSSFIIDAVDAARARSEG